MGKAGKPSLTPPNWTDAKIQYFLNALIVQKLEGKKANSGFKCEAWNTVTRDYNDKFKTTLIKDQLKNRYNEANRQYKIVDKLRKTSGVGWNEETSMIEVEPWFSWPSYADHNKGALAYRDKPFPLYEAMKELVGDPDLAVTGVRTTGPSSKKVRAKQDQLTAEELALDDSDEEDLQGKTDHVRGAELTIDDSDEEGLPSFDPHSTKPIDHSNPDENEISSPDPTPKIKGKAPQQSVSTHLTANDSPSQAKPKTRTRPASKANIATALNNAASLARNKNNSALERERVRAKSSAAHDARKAARAEEAARLEQECLALKKSAAPSLKEAMKLFKEDTTIQSQDDKSRLAGSKVLRTEDNCAFFIQLEANLRWPWILEEIELSARK